jgi:NAD(P)-dependent dehydrogenase (short-subunit alcohol dehydrogenase family)
MSKTILLNGATGGLGGIIANFLADEGHRLILTGRNELAEHLPSGENITFVPCDVCVESDIIRLVKETESKFGKIDILINAAGVSGSGMSWKLSADSWNEALSVNLTSPFLFIREVLPGMRNRKFGRIINLSSVVAFKGVPGTAAYAASKAGLDGLTRAVAAENAQKGITVNNLALGYFDAGMLYDIPEDIREQIRQSIPMNEFGNPNNITSLIRWIISDESNYFTGQTVQINGGLYS